MPNFDIALADEVKKRLDASYDEVLYGLEQGEGDLLRALAAIERKRREERATEQGGEVIGRALDLAKQGQLKGLRVRLGERTIREMPLPKGIGGAIFGAALSTLITQLVVELVKRESAEQDVQEDEDVEALE
jgi:hypothetical protein